MYPYLKGFVARQWTERRVAPFTPPLRILVVDDNENGAKALADYLSFEAMECRIALGGVQAIEVGGIWLPQVIVMDISMPEVNGFEATFALRSNVQTANIVILAFTALDEADVLKHLTDTTFDGYCQKGQLPAALIALIGRFTD